MNLIAAATNIVNTPTGLILHVDPCGGFRTPIPTNISFNPNLITIFFFIITLFFFFTKKGKKKIVFILLGVILMLITSLSFYISPCYKLKNGVDFIFQLTLLPDNLFQILF